MTWPAGGWPAARDAGTAEVVLLGDSITSGQSASDRRSRSYASRLRSRVRRYGDGGDGFSPHWTGNVDGGVLTGGTLTTAFEAAVPNGHVVVLTGALHWTWTGARGTEVALYLRRATSYGTARWRIDGGTWQPVVGAGAAGYIRAEATGLDDTAHTVEVEAQTGTVAVAGIETRRGGGCRLHIMGLGGRSSGGNAFWSASHEATAAFRAASIGRWAPHLLIVNVGVNDSNTANTTAATYQANVDAMIVAARAVRSDCDVVLVANHLGKFADNSYTAMRDSLRTLADTHGAVVVDVDQWARTRADGTTQTRTATDPTGTSWGDWSTWGWWAGGTDTVHPGDTGHAVLAHVLGDVLTAPETSPLPAPEPDVEYGGP